MGEQSQYTKTNRVSAGKERNPTEAIVRKRARRGALERALLGTLVTGSLLTVAMAAPKLLSLVKQKHLDLVLPPDPRQRLRETASRLKRKGLVAFEKRNGRIHMRLTEKGMCEMGRVEASMYSIPRPRRWDHRWRIVIFDIREKRRPDRTRVRHLLQSLGFHRLQDSVWVHPYDCEEVVALIKTEFRLGADLLYIIADAIDFDRRLREHFELPEK